MCGVAPSCPAGGKRGASASPYACRPNTGVTNGRAVPAARAPRARSGARCVLGTGSPLAHPASRPSVAPESAGPPADGDRGAALSVHRGGRNRLRRRLKEILRRYPVASLPVVDLVVRAKRTAYAAPFAQLRTELTASVTRIT